jgi:hypothetical protein
LTNHTTKPSRLSRLASSERPLHSLPIGSQVHLVHTITGEDLYGYVIFYPEEGDGIVLRRTNADGTVLLLDAVELDDDDYEIKEIHGRSV